MSQAQSHPAKTTKKKRKAKEIIEVRCKGCGYCIEFCPKHVLGFSDRFNEKGYYIPVEKLPEECSGCGMCQMICPDFAIFLVEEKEPEGAASNKPDASRPQE
jgi:2-oxoglutarate ferredoxin oxidoreductase subunit delta